MIVLSHLLFPKGLSDLFFGKSLDDRTFHKSRDALVSCLKDNSFGLSVWINQKEVGTQVEIERSVSMIANGFKTRFVGVVMPGQEGCVLKGKFQYALLPKTFVMLGVFLIVCIVSTFEKFLPAILVAFFGMHFLGFMVIFASIFNKESETIILSLLDDAP
jgi:hypothetical protein